MKLTNKQKLTLFGGAIFITGLGIIIYKLGLLVGIGMFLLLWGLNIDNRAKRM